MSATFHLYKVVDGVDFLGSRYDVATKKEREERDLMLRQDPENFTDNDFYEVKYSDGKEHEYFDLTYYKALSKEWKPNTLFKQIKPLLTFLLLGFIQLGAGIIKLLLLMKFFIDKDGF